MKSTFIFKLALALITLNLMHSPSYAADANTSAQKQLAAAVNASWRSADNRVNDQYRHPLETLSFIGIKPDTTIMEFFPNGQVYYPEILAPFTRDHGQYIAVQVKDNAETAKLKRKITNDPIHFGKMVLIGITPPTLNFGAENSVDYFLSFHNVHDFVMLDKIQASFFNEIFRVLKPGGVLGIVEHRAAANSPWEDVTKTGYLPEAFVIAEAEKAGFKFEASSPINNNPKDTKDYRRGVWTLPPTFAEGDKDREKYAAIGESDRMTLRFVKPKK